MYPDRGASLGGSIAPPTRGRLIRRTWRWRNALRRSAPAWMRTRLTCEVCCIALGVAVMRHIMDGCDDAMAQGWNEAACVCLTHAFPVQDIEADMGRKDIMPEQQRFIDGYLKRLTYDL